MELFIKECAGELPHGSPVDDLTVELVTGQQNDWDGFEHGHGNCKVVRLNFFNPAGKPFGKHFGIGRDNLQTLVDPKYLLNGKVPPYGAVNARSFRCGLTLYYYRTTRNNYLSLNDFFTLCYSAFFPLFPL